MGNRGLAAINAGNVVSDGRLTSPFGDGKAQAVDGSVYLHIVAAAEKHLAEGDDWIWLNDVRLGQTLTARRGLEWARK
jgi:hypothetical protein